MIACSLYFNVSGRRTKFIAFDVGSGERAAKFDAHASAACALRAFPDGVRPSLWHNPHCSYCIVLYCMDWVVQAHVASCGGDRFVSVWNVSESGAGGEDDTPSAGAAKKTLVCPSK